MKRVRKIVIKTCLIFITLIPIAAFAHYIIFPQETRSILIDYSDFTKEGRLYFNAATSHNKIDSLQSLIRQAFLRNKNFWGQTLSNPKFIYCDKENDFKKYCANASAPACTYFKAGVVIVLSADAIDLDIIAHEISHAELYGRMGFYKFNYTIPSWFKHGLAMQNDYRNYYSEDTLKALSNNFKHLPDVRKMQADKDFYAGSKKDVMLNYMAAKHEVKNWYTKTKLNHFIEGINSGKTFQEAFNQ